MGRSRASAGLAPIVAAAGLAVAAPGAAAAPVDRTAVESWLGLAGTVQAPALPRREVVVVLQAPAAADLPGAIGSKRAYRAALRGQTSALAGLARRGLHLHVRARYARVLNAVVVDLPPDGVARLVDDPAVAAVFPVRAYVPAGLVADALPAAGADARPLPSAGPRAGHGVTVALLDGPIDRRQRLLAGRLAPPGPGSAPASRGPLAAHATALAAVVAGRGGPHGLTGVAPSAKILALDVLRRQPGDVLGATTQSLLHGFERAADPNDDGDLADHARIVLAPVAARFASFGDGAEARAAAGLAALGSVVIAAAGNDGPTGLEAGTIGAPAGAADVLAVGATDGRATLPGIDLTVAGEPVSGAVLGGRMAPAAGLTLPVTVVANGLRDASGASLVTGAAALVRRNGQDLAALARDAAKAGAGALLLYGDDPLPAGSLGLDDRVGLPVVDLGAGVGAGLATSIAAGGSPQVVFGAAASQPNPAAGRVAAFSSTGPGLDGTLKPDVVAPGVAVVTALAGGGLTSASGTSVAAAQVAGLAAALAARHPGWTAERIRGALVSTAGPTPDPVAAQGGGVPDLARASGVPILASPASLALGGVAPGGVVRGRVTVHNEGSTPLTVRVAFEPDAAAGAAVAVAPAAFVITPGAEAPLTVTLRLTGQAAPGDVAGGWLVLAVDDGPALRVPVAALAAAPRPRLVRDLAVEQPVPTVGAGPVIAATVGVVARRPAGAVRIVGVERLTVDVERGTRLIGRVYEARQLVPGRYRFALPGVLADGQPLDPGRYRLRVTATAPDGSRTVARVRVVVPKP